MVKRAGFVVAIALAACGDSGSTTTTHDLAVAPDLSTGSAGNPANVGKACGAIFECWQGGDDAMTCAMASPAPSQGTWTALQKCIDMTCGTMAAATGPCGSGGTSDACDFCHTNTYAGPNGPYIDPDTMMPLLCNDDGTGPMGMPKSCGACDDVANTCVSECWGDMDCAGITTDKGVQTTCKGATMTAPGQCN